MIQSLNIGRIATSSIQQVTVESSGAMDLFVDFQGFKDPANNFIIKEFAVATSDGQLLQHWLVRSPYSFSNLDSKTKRQCNWATKNYHGIEWQDGDITIQSLHRQLMPILKDSIICTKGLEKVKYLKEFFQVSQVYDLENYPSLKCLHTPHVRCLFHRQTENMTCAYNNVLKLLHFHNN